MRLLLDTHAFLWFVAGDTSVSLAVRAAIIDPANQTYVSIASAWEVAIKAGLGKLKVDAPSVREFFGEQIEGNGFAYLPIEPPHVFRAGGMPLHHRDPFDRLLIAQALEEGMTLVSREAATFGPYGVALLW